MIIRRTTLFYYSTNESFHNKFNYRYYHTLKKRVFVYRTDRRTPYGINYFYY